ncbi:MAG: arginine--tRNA ligase [Phycisphaerales bacterium]
MTHDPVEILNDRFLSAMRAAFSDLPEGADPLIAPSRNPQFGDFQSNAAMGLAKALGKKPREVAGAIVANLDVSDLAEPVDEGSIAGPGFINIRLKPDALASLVSAIDTPDLGVAAPASPETVVVDLCGVNLAKQMHVGHLRATVIGDTLARVFERLGLHVRRQNHVGDWGLPIAMVSQALKERMDAGTIDPGALTLDDLESLYRQAQRACAPDTRGLAMVERFDLGPKARAELEEQVASAEEAAARAREMLVRLQAGEAEAVAIWERIATVTMAECLRTCERLHTDIDEGDSAGESSYRDELPEVVADLERRGVAVESDGALVVPLDDVGIAEPCLVRKRDGGFLYATTDLAAIRRRVQQLGASRVIYCVDARQSLHFRQAFAAAHKAGYTKRSDGVVASLEHAAFGTVLGEDGRPFKTRSGENVKLSALLDEAIARAETAVGEKNPDLPEAARKTVAEAVGVSAIKYADLSSDRVKDYVFAFDRMLAFEGDTGPYLQYALVRVRSIFRRAASELGEAEAEASRSAPLLLETPEEKTLALLLLRYAGALESVGASLEPHRLCNYLHDLAGAFSQFFQACPVLKAETEALRRSRLRLSDLTGRVLEDGMTTLGLVALEQM